MKNIIKITFIALFLCGCGYLSTSHFNDLKADDASEAIMSDAIIELNYAVIDMNGDGIHDKICNCGYCQAGNSDYVEVYTNNDIYYLYHDSLTSETGRTYIVGTYIDLKDSLSEITARETEK